MSKLKVLDYQVSHGGKPGTGGRGYAGGDRAVKPPAPAESATDAAIDVVTLAL
jgi:hypothetical protein